MPRMPEGGSKRLAPLAASAALIIGLAGCSVADQGENLVAGKQAFVQKCGSCHVLSRAGTTGVTGPNLDDAFRQARQDGFGESTFQGLVHRQIEIPARRAQKDPITGKPLPMMPANLLKGQAAQDVAAYVASAVGRRGDDTGQLARVGVKRSTKQAKEVGGTLDIPTDPTGSLAYQFAGATATAGKVTLESKNDASIDHNIAIEGNGLNLKGPVVKGGAVSKVAVDLKPGTYTFYCSVPGHREGGMVGKITVK
jgi:mono/diheme cytochrome c family protein